MADYKLKLDIDAALLQKKIAAALKATGLSGLSGAGSAFSGAGANPFTAWNQQQAKANQQAKFQNQKFLQQRKQQHDRDMEAATFMRQMAVKQEAYKNAMVRKSGEKTAQSFQMIGQMLGGRYGGTGGALLGQLAAQRGFWKQPKSQEEQNMYLAPGRLGGKTAASKKKPLGDYQRENRMPRAVKLAGVAAGAAGMLGLGKMIIDSSPLMQTMLKLMNLGIMFTLRPIGDFIGTLFRPMMINFVKWSVGWYKMWADNLPTWEAWGNALAEFMADPFNGLKGLLIESLKTLGTMFDIPVADIARMITDINIAWNQISEAVKPFIAAWNIFWNMTLPQFLEDLFSGKIVRDFKKGFEDAWKGFIGFFEGIWQGITDGFAKFWNWLKDIPLIGDFIRGAESALLGPGEMPLGGDKDSPYIAGRMEYDRIMGTNTTGDLMNKVTETFTGIEESLEETKGFWEEIADSTGEALQDAWKSFTSIGQVKNAFGDAENTSDAMPTHAKDIDNSWRDTVSIFQGAANWIASALSSIAKTTRRTSDGGREPTPQAKIASRIPDISGAFGGGGASRNRYKITLGDGRSFTQVLDPTSYAHLNRMRGLGEHLKGSPILSIQKMAAGGLITEPILGIGQNTGKGYLMGEAGPERITPGTGPANGGAQPVFNITINATNIGDVERQLKPAILKMLKESTSRAGIV